MVIQLPCQRMHGCVRTELVPYLWQNTHALCQMNASIAPTLASFLNCEEDFQLKNARLV